MEPLLVKGHMISLWNALFFAYIFWMKRLRTWQNVKGLPHPHKNAVLLIKLVKGACIIFVTVRLCIIKHKSWSKALFFSETTKSSREAARQQRRRNQNLGKKEDQHQMKTVRNSISISENNVLLHLIEFSHWSIISLWYEWIHSALMSNQTKVWKTKIGPLQGDKAWSRDPKSALFEILQNMEDFY